jgi:hypothetical protein
MPDTYSSQYREMVLAQVRAGRSVEKLRIRRAGLTRPLRTPSPRLANPVIARRQAKGGRQQKQAQDLGVHVTDLQNLASEVRTAH